MTPNNSFYEVCLFIYTNKFDKFGDEHMTAYCVSFPVAIIYPTVVKHLSHKIA